MSILLETTFNGSASAYSQPKGLLFFPWHNSQGHLLRGFSYTPHSHPEGSIVIMQGLREFSEKYYETMRDLAGIDHKTGKPVPGKTPYDIYGYDLNGQGASERYLSDRNKRHAVDLRAYDAGDLIRFRSSYVPQDKPAHIVAHSTGSLISFIALTKKPDLVSSSVLIAPPFGLRHPMLRNREALVSYMLGAWPDNWYIPGGRPWRTRRGDLPGLRPENFSSHPDRNRLQDFWTEAHPELRVGDLTAGGLKAICRAAVQARGVDTLKNFEVPKTVLLMTAGRDCLIDNAHTFRVAEHTGAGLMHFKDAGHELLMETDVVREKVLKAALQHFGARKKQPTFT